MIIKIVAGIVSLAAILFGLGSLDRAGRLRADSEKPNTNPKLLGIALVLFGVFVTVEVWFSPLGLMPLAEAPAPPPRRTETLVILPSQVSSAQVVQMRDGALRIVKDPAQGIYLEPAPVAVDDWYSLKVKDDGFEVKFPFEPLTREKPQRGGTTYSMSCDGDRLGFTVSVERSWIEEDAVAQQLWEIKRDVASGHAVVKEIKQGDASQPHAPRLETDVMITAMGRTLRFRERIFVVDKVAYCVSVYTDGDADKKRDADRFFDSFRLLKAAQP